jgi:hypothetical protein
MSTYRTWRNSQNQLHRTDGPAVEYIDGSREWWVNGNRHREDGPAAEWFTGDREWWVHGQRHRVDGPAIEWRDGSVYWYLDGCLLKFETWIKKTPVDSATRVYLFLRWSK